MSSISCDDGPSTANVDYSGAYLHTLGILMAPEARRWRYLRCLSRSLAPKRRWFTSLCAMELCLG